MTPSTVTNWDTTTRATSILLQVGFRTEDRLIGPESSRAVPTIGSPPFCCNAAGVGSTCRGVLQFPEGERETPRGGIPTANKGGGAMKPFDALRRRLRWPSASMVVAAVALFIAIGGGAYAAATINGHNIQNGTVDESKLTAAARARVDHSAGNHWGVIDRNTIGSAVADLRAGPYGSFGVTGSSAQPPFGVGSLRPQGSDNAMSGGNPQEKGGFRQEVGLLRKPG